MTTKQLEETGFPDTTFADTIANKYKMTIAERDAALMNSWRERQGSLANAEFEDGEVSGGYRRNVVRSFLSQRCCAIAH